MTGRKGRIVARESGAIEYEMRRDIDVPVDMMNISEKERFMNGEKVMCYNITQYLIIMIAVDCDY
jgi:hypothetical protein